MTPQARILAVHDTPANIELLETMLVPHGYLLFGGGLGRRSARDDRAGSARPGIAGPHYAQHGRPRCVSRFAGGSVRNDTIQAQATELASWNQTLERRLQEQVTELERLQPLRRFLPPHLADLLISAEGETLLETHHRQTAVVCCQLPGFPALPETTTPEEVVRLLAEYHDLVGEVVFQFEGSVGPLVGDRVMVFFNDPLPVEDPATQAIRLALALRADECADRQLVAPGAYTGHWPFSANSNLPPSTRKQDRQPVRREGPRACGYGPGFRSKWNPVRGRGL